ncbi:hypothetical protein GCM10028803_24270 [Larkinella knui]|uniref:DUF1080 domain-containing protein n=1 Tax=Larkinella knui TaxID=2025310 RepID=A0A3P1CW93_9BACT|nr:hypothetical protein [Larkinella knui]RRB17489.1 hypothetical protein EHT87_04160 [Larkinella knui]
MKTNSTFQVIFLSLSLFFNTLAFSQKSGNVDLGRLAKENGFKLYNRALKVLPEGDRPGVRLEERDADAGVAWLENVAFQQGTIALAMRGKDVLQRSFVGVAFHGVDDKTYDAVYFRPFNFRASDPVRHSHAVQYISLPDHDWPVLRKNNPDQYEQPIEPAPDPNGWFQARIVVDQETISVFVNDNAHPSLVVKKLNNRKDGRIGLWVGAGSGGDFANLKISPANP